MLRRRLPLLLLAGLPLVVTDAAAGPPKKKIKPSPAKSTELELDGRFPIWPTEVARIAAPLHDPSAATESVRIAALHELQQFATVVILPEIELALTDPSPEVRRLALELCATRRVMACVPEAERMWKDGEASVRGFALMLLSQDPTAEHLQLLYDAMRDPSDMVREQAINLLVDAPLDAEQAKVARQEIVAQLGDVSTRVRSTAARGLGKLGPGEGALALVRLLDDIDPTVAESAAIGLGQLEDPRTAPALQRALETPINANFARAAIVALSRIPGDEMDASLLALFDSPPRNATRTDIANAIGDRRTPGKALIEGLIERIRDTDLRESAIQALLRMGDLAVEQLQAASERGLEPDIAVEVERLLAARLLETTPVDVVLGGAEIEVPPPTPALTDREGWFEVLADSNRIDAAAVLAADPPEWFAGALVWQLDRAATAEQVHAWLTSLALVRVPILDARGDAIHWSRIAGWSADIGASVESRCLATLALGGAVGGPHDDLVTAELASRTGDTSADVRGCAALALARFGDDPVFEALLADPSPRVRALTALALRGIKRLSPRVRARLALQADNDFEVASRGAAALSLAKPEPGGRWVLVRARISDLATDPTADVQWQGFDLAGRRVDVPMFGRGSRIWAIVPLSGARVAEVVSTPLVIRPSYNYDRPPYYH